MDLTKIGAMYVAFKDKLTTPSESMKTFPAKAQEALSELAHELHISGITATVEAVPTPSSRRENNGMSNTVGLFGDGHTSEVSEKVLHVEHFKNSENGAISLRFTPESLHKFSDEEVKLIHLIATDLFTLGGRARLMDFMDKALSTEPMTGTDNQQTLTRKMGALVAQKKLSEFTGIFLNLKNFKYINKALTSPVGDLAIKIYAKAIQESIEDEEIVCRLGGDNFYVLLKKENVEKFIQRFTKFEVKLTQGPKPAEFTIQARMGIYSATAKDGVPDMMNNASIALNVAKELLTSDVIYFSNEMQVQALHRREVSAIFRNALQKGEFNVYYQPKVDIRTKQLCGSEALVRWIRHKTIVPPMDFIPILEQEGTICQLDFYVFTAVCKDIRQWVDMGIPPVRISVNFSKRHLKNRNFANDVLSIMEQNKIDSKYIEVELTEVSDYDDAKAMQDFVTIMRKNGISVSIDDFGTGYSTLNVLKNFDVNTIKLDKSLLDNIGKENSMDEVVVRNVVNLAREMHKDVIAEGVENETQAKFLEGVNCMKVQGYLFDKPLAHDDFQKRLTGEKAY